MEILIKIFIYLFIFTRCHYYSLLPIFANVYYYYYYYCCCCCCCCFYYYYYYYYGKNFYSARIWRYLAIKMDSHLSWYRLIRAYIILSADIFLLVILRILDIFRSVPYVEPAATKLTKLVEWIPENLQQLRVKISLYGISNVRFFHIIRAWKYEIFKLSEVGQMAPDVGLVRLDGSNCRLLDFMKAGRPLVVVFGSCT